MEDYPAFANSINEIRFIGKHSSTNESGYSMMSSSWKIINFFRSVPESD